MFQDLKTFYAIIACGDSMHIKRFSLGLLRSNCYVISNQGHAIIIDPGYESLEVIQYIEGENLIVDLIYITHGHHDHVGGVKQMKSHFDVLVYAPKKDIEFVGNFPLNRFGYAIPVDVWVTEGYTFDALGKSFKVYDAPGHSEGGTLLYVDYILFTGDTLFYQSIGRTDIPRANSEILYHTIKRMYHIFPKETIIYPGHGRHSTIGHEQQFNPFVRL